MSNPNEIPKDADEIRKFASIERKKNLELIENWYQSYYLWNTTYMANIFMNSILKSIMKVLAAKILELLKLQN